MTLNAFTVSSMFQSARSAGAPRDVAHHSIPTISFGFNPREAPERLATGPQVTRVERHMSFNPRAATDRRATLHPRHDAIHEAVSIRAQRRIAARPPYMARLAAAPSFQSARSDGSPRDPAAPVLRYPPDLFQSARSDGSPRDCRRSTRVDR